MIIKLSFFICFLSSLVFGEVQFERDPFKPFDPSQLSRIAGGNGTVLPVLKVQGIIDGPSKVFAVVLFKGEKKILAEGDTLGMYTVDRVSSHKIWLKGPEKTLILEVGEEMRL